MNRFDSLASPQMIVAFICATFGMISFCSAFFDLGTDSILAMAVIRLVLGTVYFLGALINIFKGIPAGNLNLIFSVCFGLFAGSNMMISSLHEYLGVDIQPLIYGIVQVFAAAYLYALLPVMRQFPLINWNALLCAASGLLCQGLCVLLGQPWLNLAGGVFFLIFSLLNIYIGFQAVIPSLPGGPQMKTVFSRRQKES